MATDFRSLDLVQPLIDAEPSFLNVLLPWFLLRREGDGARLTVRFDDDSDTIWSGHAKDHVRAMIPEFDQKSLAYQAELDRFLLEGKGVDYQFDDAEFPFRFGSGGTLPILRMGSAEYYCFFFREIFPIGWNIANGGCDSREELLQPTATIERELREELIVIDPEQERWFMFSEDSGSPLEHPKFAVTRQYWQKAVPDRDFLGFTDSEIPIKWLNGPDTVSVQIGSSPAVEDAGCFLNINARDFAIEVDKIAKLHIPESAVLCDGEVISGRLVNAPIGLFEVERFEAELAAGAKSFAPDTLFYNARRYDGGQLEEVVQEHFFPGIMPLLTPAEIKGFHFERDKYGLCPVTRSIVTRAAQLPHGQPTSPARDYSVFVSHATEDHDLAEKVYQGLKARTDQNVFLSERELYTADFSRAIDDALDSARALVAVASHPQHLRKNWVDYEWRSYFVDLMSGRKPDNAQLVTVIDGFTPDVLPRPLRSREAIQYNRDDPESTLNRLAEFCS